MANHKKHRNLSARGHCKMCKPWKINGMCRENKDFEKFSDHKRRILAIQESDRFLPEAQIERINLEFKD